MNKEDLIKVKSYNPETNQINLSGFNLSRANLSNVDLSDADLSGANLSEANLSEANLSGADLSEANLSNADLDRANLSNVYLSESDLSEASLFKANLYGANLSRTDLAHSDLSNTNLYGANLNGANLNGARLSRADLTGVDLSNANLSGVDLSNADLSGVDLSGSNLSRVNLSGAKNLLNQKTWMNENFEKNNEGYIVYKVFDLYYNPSKNWKIENDAIIEEEVNYNRCNMCGSGINFSTIKWLKDDSKFKSITVNTRYYPVKIHKCLILFEDMINVVVPYNTDGKARCGRLKVLEGLQLKELEELYSEESEIA
jgi:uncharacterized protein YjbI with pentapeptide repeats